MHNAEVNKNELRTRSRIFAFGCVLALAGAAGLLNPLTMSSDVVPVRIWISASTGIGMILLIPLLYRTQSIDLTVRWATVLGFWCLMSGFYYTGDLYYMAMAMAMPLTAAIFCSARDSSIVLAFYVLSLLLGSIGVSQQWWIPEYTPEEYSMSQVAEAIILALVVLAVATPSIWREQFTQSVIEAESDADARALSMQRHFTSVSRHAYDAILEADSGGRITAASGQLLRQLGYTVDQVLGKRLHGFVIKDDRRRASEVPLSVKSEVSGYCIEIRIASQSGMPRWVRASGGVFHDSTGSLKWVTAVQDIEDEVTTRDQLYEMSRLESLRNICGGLAHDFNNLLTVIGIYGELVETTDVRDGLLQAQQQAAELTAGLLEFSRKQDVRHEQINVGQFLSHSRSMIDHLAPPAVQLNWDIEDNNDTICIDPTQLQQVLLNLVTNAYQAMQNGGQLSIENMSITIGDDGARKQGIDPGQFNSLRICDTGNGMTPETLSRACEPFFTTKPRGQGTGLGLATVHGVVRRAGGAVVLESSVGTGTTVVVLIPQSSATVEPTLPAPEIRQNENAVTKLSILLIDDRRSLAEVLQQTLVKSGHHVRLHDNAEDAWDSIGHGQRFDLIISDIVLPGISGITLLERVRDLNPKMKAILISGYQQDDLSIVTQNPEITLFLSKPFRAAELGAAVNHLFSSKEPRVSKLKSSPKPHP